MTDNDRNKPDWDPRSDDVQRDQRAAYDDMREHCPVAYSDALQWSLFRHEDVVRVLHDPDTFSNVVSAHRAVPNGMDPPEHTVYRRIIEPYFSPERMQAFEPACRTVAVQRVQAALAAGELELMDGFATGFAVQVQCAFTGWPAELHEPLINWTRKNHVATLAQDRGALAAVAREFEALVHEQLETRAQAGANPGDDVTADLMHETVNGRPLNREEITSILRNWTVGEVGTIAASVGILAHYLAHHPDLQNALRNQPSQLPAAIDEILRLHNPLVANRRITTRPVDIGGRHIEAGERLSLNWVAANRDPRAFDEPDTFHPDRNPDKNLLYGAGIHVCPGAPLARLELRVLMEELLARTVRIEPVTGKSPVPAVYPASGFAQLHLKIQG